MELGEGLGDGEPEARSARRVAVSRPAVELVEEALALRRRDRRALVADRQPEPAIVGRRAERDGALLRRVAEGVRHEVAEDLLHPSPVDVRERRRARVHDGDPLATLRGEDGVRRGGVAQQDARRDVLPLELDPRLLQVGEVEQILHRAVETLDVATGLRDQLIGVGGVTLREELERPADDCQRSAQLVADRREELVLQLVGGAEGFGLARFGEEPVVLEDLRDQARDGLGEADVVGAECIGQRP